MTEAVPADLIRVRPVEPRDAAAISAVADESPGAAPWSLSQYEGAARADYEGWLAEQNGRVVGFVFTRVAADEVEILNLAVAQRSRRSGIASQLIARALAHAKAAGAVRAYLEVRPSNGAAMALYVAFGFAESGRRACYYSGPVEDALVLSKKLS
ncbi:MAG: ribosomal protein S18-alanine N-acetyltransferase [Candidatus Acidiferrales bacterium]